MRVNFLGFRDTFLPTFQQKVSTMESMSSMSCSLEKAFRVGSLLIKDE